MKAEQFRRSGDDAGIVPLRAERRKQGENAVAEASTTQKHGWSAVLEASRMRQRTVNAMVEASPARLQGMTRFTGSFENRTRSRERHCGSLKKAASSCDRDGGSFKNRTCPCPPRSRSHTRPFDRGSQSSRIIRPRRPGAGDQGEENWKQLLPIPRSFASHDAAVCAGTARAVSHPRTPPPREAQLRPTGIPKRSLGTSPA